MKNHLVSFQMNQELTHKASTKYYSPLLGLSPHLEAWCDTERES